MERTKKHISAYLRSHKEAKIQLGAGQNKLEGWFNTDYFPRHEIYFLNSTKAIPAPANSFDYAFSEHHIEHIHLNDAKFLAKEIHRILKPGGVFRVCTPNLLTYLEAYFEKDPMNNPYVSDTINDWIKGGFYNAKNYAPAENEESVAFFVNDIFLNYDHKFIFDGQTLSQMLLNAGFSSTRLCQANESSIVALSGIEAHVPSKYTLVVEAVK
ncbi:MAG: methyltransferase domain-containing protein [Pedobacter sp.]|nr:methyltransferase domain-containing protein [Pedobacter sp.]